MKQKKGLAFCVALLIAFAPALTLAHSGRTDSSGGHKDNKNKSGLGSYHYHCGGHPAHLHSGGVCPYSSSSKKTQSSSKSSAKSSKTVKAPTVNASSVSIVGEKEMSAGEAISLLSKIYPSNVSKKNVTWTSSNSKVATVNKSGKVTAKKVSTKQDVTITCKSADGFASEAHTITVYPAAKTVDITYNDEVVSSLVLVVGDYVSLTARTEPIDAVEAVKWKSSNNRVANIQNIGNVSLLKEGKATITAEVGKKTSKLQIEVVRPDKPHLIKLSCDSTLGMKVGESIFIDAEVFPQTASEVILWKSSNSKVIDVDGGNITAIKKGKATITAYIQGTKVKTTITISVK